MTETTQTFTDLEPLAHGEVAMVSRSLGMIAAMICRLGDADPSRGKAKILNGRCLWTRDGCRIEITLIPGGGHVASVGKVTDPLAPGAGTFQEQ